MNFSQSTKLKMA